MVTTHRARLAPHNIDMCAPLRANKGFIDLTQSDRIPPDGISSDIPGHSLLAFIDGDDDDDLVNVSVAFSFANVGLSMLSHSQMYPNE